MADYEKNTLLCVGDAQGNKVKCYPTTKAEYVEGLKEFIDSNESDESENNGSSSSGSNTFNRYATIVIGTATSGYTASDVDYLCTGSADQTIINSAISTLVNGGKILLLEGTYTLAGNIVIDKDNITLEGMGASTVLNRNSTDANSYVIAANGVIGCTFQHITCTGGHSGIYFYGSSNNRVYNCICNDNKYYGIYILNTADSGNNNNLIIDSCICNNNAYGIEFTRYEITDDDDVYIINNICNNNTLYGIRVRSAYGTTGTYESRNINITNNNCIANGTGIYANKLDRSTINGNVCQHNSNYGITCYNCTNTIVTANNCSSNSEYGIYTQYGYGGNTLDGNMCNDNTSYGIYLRWNSSNYLTDIITSNQANTGIYTGSYTPSILENNYTG